MSDYLLECCVDSVESAMAAAEGGADRLELCAALIIGGISPSLALFKQVKECCALPVRALLRPRFGDFLYTDYEFRIIRREVELFREAGAEGVVIGCLAEDGSLNRERMKELAKAADGIGITLHRAFDVCADPVKAYEQAWELGIDTILTSGQESDCLKGMPLLKRLSDLQKKVDVPQTQADSFQDRANGLQMQAGNLRERKNGLQTQREKARRRIEGPRIMAGSGVTPDVIRRFLEETDITAYHLSAKKIVDSGMRYRREGVPMGLPAMSEYSIYRTDKDIVAAARRVLTEHKG
jgi:copper homeostasis protein